MPPPSLHENGSKTARRGAAPQSVLARNTRLSIARGMVIALPVGRRG
jgi:hypothetical protein